MKPFFDEAIFRCHKVSLIDNVWILCNFHILVANVVYYNRYVALVEILNGMNLSTRLHII